MSELGENLVSLTTNRVMKTERDLLRQKVIHFKAKYDSLVAQILRVRLNKETIIDDISDLKDQVCSNREVAAALTF